MSITEKIIRNYIDTNNISIRGWENVSMVYLQPSQKADIDVYHFAYTVSNNHMMELYTWYLPKKQFDNELRKYKIKNLLCQDCPK